MGIGTELPALRPWFLAILMALSVSACSSAKKSPLMERPAPDVRLTLLRTGERLPLSALRGKRIVLAFWATWCRYSRPVLEELNELARVYSSSTDTVFIAVSLDELDSEPEVRRRANQERMNALLHAFSGNEYSDEAYLRFGVEEIPHIFVIDRSGIMIRSTGSAGDVRDVIVANP